MIESHGALYLRELTITFHFRQISRNFANSCELKLPIACSG